MIWGAIIIGWIGCYVLGRSLIAGAWKRDFNDPRGAPGAVVLAFAAPVVLISALACWAVVWGFPAPTLDWLPWRKPKTVTSGLRVNEVGVTQTPITSSAAMVAIMKPDLGVPNTLGWRTWVWNIRDHELISPHMGTRWNGSELRCETWDETSVVRGVAGIHAHLVPADWWKRQDEPAAAYLAIGPSGPYPAINISGVVERFDRYVLGEGGWRAEWVLIRKLSAPSQTIGLALEQAFPDVEIIYD